MIDHKYVEEFTFENIIYMMIGATVLMGPWLLTNSFWSQIDKLTAYQMVSYNIFLLIGVYLFFLHVLLKTSHHAFKTALVIAFRRSVFVYVTIFATVILILLLYNQVSLSDPASIFSRKVFSSLVACLLSGMFFDLIMHK